MAITKERLDKELVASFLDENLGIDQIRRACELAREYLDLDLLFVDTNTTYKYQFTRPVLCVRGKEPTGTDSVCLTEALYETVVALYTAGPISDVGIPAIDGSDYAVLNSAILRNGVLCGMVGFRTAKPHAWTDDEREVIDSIRKLMLHHLGMSMLGTGARVYDQYLARSAAPEVLSCYHVDLLANRSHAIKLAPFLRDYVSEWEPYESLLETYTRNFVDPLYAKRLLSEFSLDHLAQAFSERRRNLEMEVPRVVKGQTTWVRFSIEILSFEADGRPSQALMMVEDVAEDEQRSAFVAQDFETDRTAYSVIAGVNLDEGRYVVYVDNRDVTAEAGPLDPYGSYQGILDYVTNSVIDRAHAGEFSRLFSSESLCDRFDRGEREVAIEFQCEVYDRELWIRLEAVPVQTYTPQSRRVVLYFSDITERREQERRLREMEASLERERERVLEQRLQLLHDPLTGAFNRAGFEKALAALENDSESIGMLMIDVDHFKEINDAYGHGAGDRALVEVVSLLESVFRSKDRVFRLGGDEFCMLLRGCKPDAWESIRHKLAVVHTGLRRRLKDIGSVTLSVGFVVSEDGYVDDMPRIADKALYHTKRNGRAGLTELGLDQEVLHEWNDTEAAVDERASQNDVGRWRFECPRDGSAEPKLFLDEPARFLMELPESATPEDCYRAWVAAIPKRYRDLIREMQDKARAVGLAECTHGFNLPSQGEVRVRTRARYIGNESTIEYAGYFALLKGTDIVLSYDDDQFLMQAIVNVCFRAYYIELDTGTFYIVKGAEDEAERNFVSMTEVLGRYVDSCVDFEYREDAHAFCDLSTLGDRLAKRKFVDLDYRVITGEGWCQGRFYPVKWNEKGQLTHVLLTATVIDEDKRRQLQREKEIRDSLRMQLRVGELVSKTKIVQTGLMDKVTGQIRIWLNAVFTGKGLDVTFDEAKAWGRKNVYAPDAVSFEREYDFDSIVRDVEENGSTTLTYRMDDGSSSGVRTLVHHYESLKGDPSKLLMVIEDATDLVPAGIGWLTEFDVLDSVNERMAIFDRDTYDIVFMNRVLREKLGVSQADLANKKCYQVFGGVDAPCAYCSQLMPESGSGGLIRRQVPGCEGASLVHGSLMTLNGQRFRVEHAISASEVDESIDALESLLGSEHKLISCVQRLIKIGDPQEAVAYLLDCIVEHYGCDRACLANVTDVSRGTILMERDGEGIEPKFAPGQVFPITDFMQWEDVYSPIKLRRGFTTCDDDGGQKWMRVMGLENLLILSFAYGDGKTGYISIDNVRRHADDDNWIGTLAFFISNELGKQ